MKTFPIDDVRYRDPEHVFLMNNDIFETNSQISGFFPFYKFAEGVDYEAIRFIYYSMRRRHIVESRVVECMSPNSAVVSPIMIEHNTDLS